MPRFLWITFDWNYFVSLLSTTKPETTKPTNYLCSQPETTKPANLLKLKIFGSANGQIVILLMGERNSLHEGRR
ncbi:hypothetical protein VV11_012985 [Trichodesmium erythraeum 21-75]|nr:hypothetical protein [Trichodesmium erythraeum 21-75]